MLIERPELRPRGDIRVSTGDITAVNGSIAAGVVNGSTITINNQ